MLLIRGLLLSLDVASRTLSTFSSISCWCDVYCRGAVLMRRAAEKLDDRFDPMLSGVLSVLFDSLLLDDDKERD